MTDNEVLKELMSIYTKTSPGREHQALDRAIQCIKSQQRAIDKLHEKIKYYDAPCSGDMVMREELSSILWTLLLGDEKEKASQ